MDRIKIDDLVIGSKCNVPLVVKTVTAKETKTGKPYLFFELYDGTEAIVGNYWDWNGNVKPEKNTILNVVGKVDVWMGKKQININALTTNTDLELAEFMPASEHDLGEAYKFAYSFLSSVTNDTLRSIALGLLEDEQALWITVPGAKTVHHAYVGGTLVHSLSVASIAKSIAENVPGANIDLCMVGGFLHDFGKLFTYSINGVSIEMTDTSRLLEHSFLGAYRIGNWATTNINLDGDSRVTLEMLLHIILSHHGRPEYGAAVSPLSIEAHIVSHADGIDAKAEQIRDASKGVEGVWTEKIWSINNHTHLATGFVQQATANPYDEATT